MTWIDDGCGNFWPDVCPDCGAPMQVVRPGDCRCSNECERYILHITFPDGTILPARMVGLHLVENLQKALIDIKLETRVPPDQQVMIAKIFKLNMIEWYRSK